MLFWFVLAKMFVSFNVSFIFCVILMLFIF